MISWNSLHTHHLFKKGKLYHSGKFSLNGCINNHQRFTNIELMNLEYIKIYFFLQILLPSLFPARGPRLDIGFVHLPFFLLFLGNSIPNPLGILFSVAVM